MPAYAAFARFSLRKASFSHIREKEAFVCGYTASHGCPLLRLALLMGFCAISALPSESAIAAFAPDHNHQHGHGSHQDADQPFQMCLIACLRQVDFRYLGRFRRCATQRFPVPRENKRTQVILHKPQSVRRRDELHNGIGLIAIVVMVELIGDALILIAVSVGIRDVKHGFPFRL